MENDEDLEFKENLQSLKILLSNIGGPIILCNSEDGMLYLSTICSVDENGSFYRKLVVIDTISNKIVELVKEVWDEFKEIFDVLMKVTKDAFNVYENTLMSLGESMREFASEIGELFKPANEYVELYRHGEDFNKSYRPYKYPKTYTYVPVTRKNKSYRHARRCC